MIELKDVNFKYKNGDMVLKDINLKIHEKEFVTIIGKNGSGKSTLLKLIGGITKATKGEAIVDDIDLNNKKNFMSIRKKVGIVFQNPEKQRITIASVLSMGTKYIVMDEPTAMLDSEGKETVYEIVKELKKQGYTIIYATNVMDEILYSDRIILMEKGMIAKEIKPNEILENIEELKERNLQIPPKIQTLLKLRKKGINIELEEIM